MSCPNCERLREELIGNVKNMKSQFDGSGLIREGHNVACDSFIRVIDALALPSEKSCEHDSGDRWSPQNGTHYSKHPLKEFITECPFCAPVKKECEHEVPGGWRQEGEPFMNSDGERKKCPFCRTSRSPVKKEPEEKSPEDIAEEVFKDGGRTPSEMHSSWYKKRFVEWLRSERSTAPKESGREEAMLRVVDVAKKLITFKGWPEESFANDLEDALDALEALEKRRKV